MHLELPLSGVYIGRADLPLGPEGLLSGVAKRPLAAGARLQVGLEGIGGDEQGDRRNHGGPEKAIHHYALDHYAFWREQLPEARARFEEAPAFGENLSTLGLTEGDVCIGDVVRWGSARLQVAQGRQPCWRIGAFNGAPRLPFEVQASARTGWYYRVLEPGIASASDPLVFVDRPHSDWSVARILRILYVDTLDREALEGMAGLATLAAGWRTLAQRRLDRGQVEDWQRRLTGSAGTP